MSKLSFPPLIRNISRVYQGKVRDSHEIPGHPDLLLIIATSRVSTHNVIHLNSIPYKNQVLTALTIFWLKHLFEQAGIPHHLVAYGREIYKYLPGSRSDYPDDLHLYAIIVKKLTIIPIEFIFRSYMAGSLWKGYLKDGKNPYGLNLESGLQLMSPFDPPLFTPTEKSEKDDPVTVAYVESAHPEASALAARAFNQIREYLLVHHIELVDSKFEIGFDIVGKLYVADEISTPDSSRFTDLHKIKRGREPVWLDKQPLRDEAEKVWGDGPKKPLLFSSSAVQQTSARYLDIFQRITRQSLEDFQEQSMSRN